MFLRSPTVAGALPREEGLFSYAVVYLTTRALLLLFVVFWG